MKRFIETLWDLIKPNTASEKPRTSKRKKAIAPASARKPRSAKYDSIVREELDRYGIRVRRWRKAMTGIAWYVEYKDGTVKRLIESPRPKSEMSLAIFLHEIGHHAIGFHTYKPRCLEEYYAWQYALDTMRKYNVEPTDSVLKRYHASMRYAVAKAARRGIRSIPAELAPFIPETRRTA